MSIVHKLHRKERKSSESLLILVIIIIIYNMNGPYSDQRANKSIDPFFNI